MRRFRGSLAAAAIASAFGMAAATMAQTPTEPVVDHIHLSVPDQAKAVEWYQKYFAGQAMKEAPDRLMLGDTRLIFLKSDKAQPSSGSGDTLTSDQGPGVGTQSTGQDGSGDGSSGDGSSGDGFIGSQGTGSDDLIEDGSPGGSGSSGADATGGSDFANQGRGALEEDENEDDSGQSGSTGGSGGSGGSGSSGSGGGGSF